MSLLVDATWPRSSQGCKELGETDRQVAIVAGGVGDQLAKTSQATLLKVRCPGSDTLSRCAEQRFGSPLGRHLHSRLAAAASSQPEPRQGG
jgi:hypothetical protein